MLHPAFALCRRLDFDSMSKQFRLSYASRVAVVVETSHVLFISGVLQNR